MDNNWTIIFESHNRQTCSDRALVLTSLNIPHKILSDDLRYMLTVPANVFEKARYEIWQYEKENQQALPQKSRRVLDFQNAVPGIVGYVLVVCLIVWLANESAFNKDWLSAGRIDGNLIRQGEWWRTLTALTLHSGFRHLAANIGFGILFGIFAGRLFGSGLTWLCVVIASGLANTLNTLLLASSHRSIGASTAVFATLGLVAGFVWRAKLMVQDRWSYRLGPIVGGIALLAYTGTGNANTDIGAHLAGFVCGFGVGMLLTLLSKIPTTRQFQLMCGTTTLAILAAAWIIALQLWT
jgi:membrane associated rhomboid family serine protease